MRIAGSGSTGYYSDSSGTQRAVTTTSLNAILTMPADFSQWPADLRFQYLKDKNEFVRDLILHSPAGNRPDFTHADLCQLDLRDMDLSGINFTAAQFSGAWLDRSNMQQSVVKDVDFSLVASMQNTEFTYSQVNFPQCIAASNKGARFYGEKPDDFPTWGGVIFSSAVGNSNESDSNLLSQEPMEIDEDVHD